MFADLREWMAAVEQKGQLLVVHGAHSDLELGGITDIAMEKIGRPALLFDRIIDHRPSYRVLANVLTAPDRIALALNMPTGMAKMEMVRECRRFLTSMPLVPPRVVSAGPVLQNVQIGEAVDLLQFPAPRWHEGDGGRYIGTGSVVIMKDPDSSWINLGCYRLMVHDRRRLGLMISAGKQGRLIMEKYWRRGQPCPVAVTFGQDILLYLMAGFNAPAEVGEYDIAGGIRGQPVDVISGELTGLPIPATAEIAVEGFVHEGDLMPEGPFGEWTGYYAGGRKPETCFTVERLMFRNDPIILGTIPRKPPSDDTYLSSFLTSAAVWQQLESAGIPGVAGVWGHEAAGSRMLIAVAIKQMHAGHAKHAGMVAAHCYAGGYLNKFVVVVDDDIDPTSLDDVVWALCTRTDAATDLEVIRQCWSSPLDPMASPLEQPMFTSKTVIDACRPWARRGSFPAVVAATPELRASLLAKWGELLRFPDSR